jgi:hypothetical protein
VCVDYIHVGEVKALEGQVHALDDVLSREAVVVERLVGVGAVGSAPVDLVGY